MQKIHLDSWARPLTRVGSADELSTRVPPPLFVTQNSLLSHECK